jgi:hypothetical protein
MKPKITFKIGKLVLNVITHSFENSGKCYPFNHQSSISNRVQPAECTHLYVNTEAKQLILYVRKDLSFENFMFQNFLNANEGFPSRYATLQVDNLLGRIAQSGTYDMDISDVEIFSTSRKHVRLDRGKDMEFTEHFPFDEAVLQIKISKLSVFEVSAYIEPSF